jgi:hypothetical protein
MPVSRGINYDDVLAVCDSDQRGVVWSSSAVLADRTISIDCDDRAVFDDFFAAFGGGPPVEVPRSEAAFVSASIRLALNNAAFGCMRLWKEGRPHPIDDVFFGLSFPDCPLESRADGKWTEVWLPGEPPLFVYRDHYCLFDKSRTDWCSKLLTLLYRGSLRLREDLIFFHASALSMGDNGLLLVGPRKAGKSTTALALAARGHSVLADSCACYAPATGQLVPFRRPIGIREGPRARAVDEALAQGSLRSVYRDDSVRVDLDTLLPPSPISSAPASAIFFLRGFAPETRIEQLKNDAAEIGNLRPIYSSFANAPHTQRVFELIRLLSRARLYALWPGDPDKTARSIEEVMQ